VTENHIHCYATTSFHTLIITIKITSLLYCICFFDIKGHPSFI